MDYSEEMASALEADLPGVSASLLEDHLVVPTWLLRCSYQQQSVLLLALRGPDGVRKHHPAKLVHIAYRGTVLRAADTGRFLEIGEGGSFMSLEALADRDVWRGAIATFFAHVDELPHHYVAHLAHAAEILGRVHPSKEVARAWASFYEAWCVDCHLPQESRESMNSRLDDFGGAGARLNSLGFEFPTEYGS